MPAQPPAALFCVAALGLFGLILVALYGPPVHGDPVIIVSAHQKGGISFTTDLVNLLQRMPEKPNRMQLYLRPEWDGHERLVRAPIIYRTLPSPWSQVINVVRDPIAVVVSGMRGQRCMDRRTTFGHKEARGLHTLQQDHAKFGLPRPTQKRYCAYLTSLNESAAVLAEMVRTEKSDFANMMSAWRTTQRRPATMRSFCLEAFAPELFRSTMAALLKFARLPTSDRVVDRLQARLANSSQYQKAWSSRAEYTHRDIYPQGQTHRSNEHHAFARGHDVRYFGGLFGRASRALRCASAATTGQRSSREEDAAARAWALDHDWLPKVEM